MKKLLSIVSIVFVCAITTTAQTTKQLPASQHYPGGQDSMYAFINRKFVYPPMAKRNRIQGECIVDFTIDESGRVLNAKPIKNIGGGCGEEATRLVNLLKFNAPGYRLQTSIPINFKIK